MKWREWEESTWRKSRKQLAREAKSRKQLEVFTVVSHPFTLLPVHLDLLIRGMLSFQSIKGGGRFTERHTYDSRGSPEQLPRLEIASLSSLSLQSIIATVRCFATVRPPSGTIPGLLGHTPRQAEQPCRQCRPSLHSFTPRRHAQLRYQHMLARGLSGSYRHVPSVRHRTANHRTGDTRDVARSSRSELVVQGVSQHHPDVPSALLGRVL